MNHEAQQLERIAEALGEMPPALRSVDLVPAVRAAIAAPPPKARRSPWVAVGIAAVAAAVLVFAWPRSGGRADHSAAEFRAKSATAEQSPDRWVGVTPYRVDDSGTAQKLDDALAPRDGLVFAYSNLGPEPFDYIMVFGVDSAGEVYWYYPAHEQPGTRVSAFPIERDAAALELPDVVRHKPAAGSFVLYGVFLREPMFVHELEEIVRDAGTAARGDRLPIPDSGQHIVVTEVIQ